MMRSLWTAASGMKTQQINVDVIANNLANVNSTGFKKESMEFKNLLYQTIQAKTTSANGENKPVGAQIGLGVRMSAIMSSFEQGNLEPTGRNLDFAIEGKGFFMVHGENGETFYTRNGEFIITTAVNGSMLSTTEGLPILDENGKAILFDSSLDTSQIMISTTGEICYPDENKEPQSLGIKIGLAQFSNPAGLNKTGSGLYTETDASGEPMLESKTAKIKKSKLCQGYLESSNVSVADEMVDLIVAQRAYEMNSKAIQASDDMLSQANQLKR